MPTVGQVPHETLEIEESKPETFQSQKGACPHRAYALLGETDNEPTNQYGFQHVLSTVAIVNGTS